ncbi:hypothetical protein [Candidatus Viridilinea mediisalina]|uniref:Uncharacterized protein n=1 Tax=Candidatus Viridilinea mediisalina TaxID=2024553 RepID=A0A2A6RE89_9CHLR|nr:hypothetical protein [Candidatus Viridilinea mediisalina]PDW00625.1 hypothetical protein CJ255_20445 [Candidatus Viridilinea mediisalina]
MRVRLTLITLLVLVVLGANLMALRLSPAEYRLELGEHEDLIAVTGFHGHEQDATGTSYRWTTEHAEVLLHGPLVAEGAVLSLHLGWLPPGVPEPQQLTLRLDREAWAVVEVLDQPRAYHLLLPPATLAQGAVALGVESSTTLAPADQRAVGVRMDAVSLSWQRAPWVLPHPIVPGTQLILLLLWGMVAGWLRLAWPITAALGGVIIALLIAQAALNPGLAALYHGALLGGGFCIVALIAGLRRLLPLFEPHASANMIRGLLLISLAALVLRLSGVLYPLFFSSDLPIHIERLRNVAWGDLVLINRPYEFDRRPILIVPVVYMLMAPGMLLGDYSLAIQGTYTLVDALTPLLVGLLVFRLGLGERTALVAAILIILLPIHSVALAWGFAQQIIGQWFSLLLMVLIAGPPPQQRLGWAAVLMVTTLTLLLHPGSLLLSGVALGLFFLFGLGPSAWAIMRGHMGVQEWHAQPEAPFWRGWLYTVLGALLLALLLQYLDAARLTLQHDAGADGSADRGLQLNSLERMQQIWVALTASFAPLPMTLVVLGLAQLLWQTRGRARVLVVAWCGSTVIFFGIDLLLNMQVRYGYFSAPLVCVGVATLLTPLFQRPVGRLVAFAWLAFVLATGMLLWFDAAYRALKPSILPLTH